MILVSHPHSSMRWRVDGTLRNIDEFYAPFGIEPGQRLYLTPEQRVRIRQTPVARGLGGGGGGP